MPDRPDSVPKVEAATIYATLRDRICLLDYPPGTLLRETELAGEFGVSRTPMRAVLQRLAHDGLIDTRDGVGTIVTAPSFAEVRDVYLMRLRIAELIGQMEPRPIRPEHLTAAEALVARARTIVARFDVTEYWHINHDLHFLTAEIIGNGALREIWDRFYFQAARMWYRQVREDQGGVADDLLSEVAETCNALAQGDAVAVGYVQRNHIAYGLRRLEAAAKA